MTGAGRGPAKRICQGFVCLRPARKSAPVQESKSLLRGKLWRCRPARVAQVGCKPSFCSLTCLVKHGMCCPLQGKFLPKFCEGFSGPGAPATWAVAQKGVCVGTPLDRDSPLDRCDLFHLKKFSAGHKYKPCVTSSAAAIGFRSTCPRHPLSTTCGGCEATTKGRWPVGFVSRMQQSAGVVRVV